MIALLKKNENSRILNLKISKSEVHENLNTRKLPDLQYIPPDLNSTSFFLWCDFHYLVMIFQSNSYFCLLIISTWETDASRRAADTKWGCDVKITIVTSRFLLYINPYSTEFWRAKAKRSICSPNKWADTAFWLCRPLMSPVVLD